MNNFSKEERELMVNHRSDLLTQDFVLKGIFQNTKLKKFGTSFDFPLIRYENKTGDITYPKYQLDELRNLELSLKEFEKIEEFLSEKILEYKKYLKKFEKEIQSDRNKEQKIIEFFDESLKATGLIPYFSFENSLAGLLEKEGISQNEIPSTETYASRASNELIKINDKYQNNNNQEQLEKDLVEFCEKFGYLGMKYLGGKPWELDDARKMLQDLKGKSIIEFPENLDENKSPYFNLAANLLFARTQNWEAICWGCFLFRKFIIKYFSDQIKYDDILNLRIDELLELIKSGEKLIRKEEDENFILEIKEDGVHLLSGEDDKVEKFDYDGGDLKGVSAQKGRVRGEVKVVLEVSESEKVNKGDILVATMSTPDFLPAMNKAAAFVTDIGGITCHAAIVAREMKKPCVIGTKIATKVLKDGDLIEVDANEGVVRILERK